MAVQQKPQQLIYNKYSKHTNQINHTKHTKDTKHSNHFIFKIIQINKYKFRDVEY